MLVMVFPVAEDMLAMVAFLYSPKVALVAMMFNTPTLQAILLPLLMAALVKVAVLMVLLQVSKVDILLGLLKPMVASTKVILLPIMVAAATSSVADDNGGSASGPPHTNDGLGKGHSSGYHGGSYGKGGCANGSAAGVKGGYSIDSFINGAGEVVEGGTTFTGSPVGDNAGCSPAKGGCVVRVPQSPGYVDGSFGKGR